MMKYSFIIPARNEERYIQKCIQSITSIPEIHDYEIILVDNGSKDTTVQIAKGEGVNVIHKYNCFVGALRNFGAQVSKGEILCFIDADCVIKPGWFKQVETYAGDLIGAKIGILGADYMIPDDSNLIQRSWFSHQRPEFIGQGSIIPAGNMIISRQVFDKIGGFDESITSGEDYELCERAKQQGFSVLHDYRMACVHYGNPSTFGHFYRRERWHGKGMVADFKHPLRSRPLLISFTYLLSYIAGLAIAGLSLHDVSFVRFLPYLLIPTILPLAALSVVRSVRSGGLYLVPVLCLLYVIYSIARSISLVEILISFVRRHSGKAGKT